MTKKILLAATFLFILAGLMGGAAGTAGAGSLWNDRTNWVADRRPSAVGDIVTVVVNERTKTKDQGKTDVSNQTKTGWGDGRHIRLPNAFGFSGKSNMKGDGSTERTHTAQTR